MGRLTGPDIPGITLRLRRGCGCELADRVSPATRQGDKQARRPAASSCHRAHDSPCMNNPWTNTTVTGSPPQATCIIIHRIPRHPNLRIASGPVQRTIPYGSFVAGAAVDRGRPARRRGRPVPGPDACSFRDSLPIQIQPTVDKTSPLSTTAMLVPAA